MNREPERRVPLSPGPDPGPEPARIFQKIIKLIDCALVAFTTFIPKKNYGSNRIKNFSKKEKTDSRNLDEEPVVNGRTKGRPDHQ